MRFTRTMSISALIAISGASNVAAQSTFSNPFPLNTLNGVDGFQIAGAAVSDRSGDVVTSAGDMNGDGYDDVLITSWRVFRGGLANVGEAWVVFGGPDFSAANPVDLAALNGANGFRIIGEIPQFAEFGGELGGAAAAAGDVNADGFDDIILGAIEFDLQGGADEGRAYVIFGGPNVGSTGAVDLGALNGANGFKILADPGDFRALGSSVAGLGDVNGDGVDDVLVGQQDGGAPGLPSAGRAFVIFGRAGLGSSGSLSTPAFSPADGAIIIGGVRTDTLGRVASSAGDVNGDGFADILLGSEIAGSSNGTGLGRAWVVFGRADLSAGGPISTASLNGANGFTVVTTGGQSLATSVASAGDFNADGFHDIIVSDVDANGFFNGEAYLIYGGSSVGSAGTISVDTLNGADGFVMRGIGGADTGNSVGGLGDLNADGFDDVIIGARLRSSSTGTMYVVYGGDNVAGAGLLELASINGSNGFLSIPPDLFDELGLSVAGAGDVNGDSLSDLIVSAPGGDPFGRSSAGETYVIYGRFANEWSSSAGGDFDTGSNWRLGQSPTRGRINIDTEFGVSINGPTGALSCEELLVRARNGRTTFDMAPSSLIQVERPFVIEPSVGFTGGGTLVADAGFVNTGLFEPRTMTINSTTGVINMGDLKLQTLTSAELPANLTVFGQVTNDAAATMFMRGSSDLETSQGFINNGLIDIGGASATITGDMTNNGSLNVSLFSTAILRDNLINTGDIVVVADSTLLVLGSFSGAGVSAPSGGAGGNADFRGAFNPGLASEVGITNFGVTLGLSGGSVTTFQIGGVTPGTQHDQVQSTADVFLGGQLAAEFVNGFVPSRGDAFTVIETTGALFGAFSSESLPALPDGLGWSVAVNAQQVRLQVVCLGDLNGDGQVSAQDLAGLLGAWGPVGAFGAADLKRDGVVNAADLSVLLGVWGGCS